MDKKNFFLVIVLLLITISQTTSLKKYKYKDKYKKIISEPDPEPEGPIQLQKTDRLITKRAVSHSSECITADSILENNCGQSNNTEPIVIKLYFNIHPAYKAETREFNISTLEEGVNKKSWAGCEGSADSCLQFSKMHIKIEKSKALDRYYLDICDKLPIDQIFLYTDIFDGDGCSNPEQFCTTCVNENGIDDIVGNQLNFYPTDYINILTEEFNTEEYNNPVTTLHCAECPEDEGNGRDESLLWNGLLDVVSIRKHFLVYWLNITITNLETGASQRIDHFVEGNDQVHHWSADHPDAAIAIEYTNWEDPSYFNILEDRFLLIPKASDSTATIRAAHEFSGYEFHWDETYLDPHGYQNPNFFNSPTLTEWKKTRQFLYIQSDYIRDEICPFFNPYDRDIGGMRQKSKEIYEVASDEICNDPLGSYAIRSSNYNKGKFRELPIDFYKENWDAYDNSEDRGPFDFYDFDIDERNAWIFRDEDNRQWLTVDQISDGGNYAATGELEITITDTLVQDLTQYHLLDDIMMIKKRVPSKKNKWTYERKNYSKRIFEEPEPEQEPPSKSPFVVYKDKYSSGEFGSSSKCQILVNSRELKFIDIEVEVCNVGNHQSWYELRFNCNPDEGGGIIKEHRNFYVPNIDRNQCTFNKYGLSTCTQDFDTTHCTVELYHQNIDKVDERVFICTEPLEDLTPPFSDTAGDTDDSTTDGDSIDDSNGFERFEEDASMWILLILGFFFIFILFIVMVVLFGNSFWTKFAT